MTGVSCLRLVLRLCLRLVACSWSSVLRGRRSDDFREQAGRPRAGAGGGNRDQRRHHPRQTHAERSAPSPGVDDVTSPRRHRMCQGGSEGIHKAADRAQSPGKIVQVARRRLAHPCRGQSIAREPPPDSLTSPHCSQHGCARETMLIRAGDFGAELIVMSAKSWRIT